MQGKKQAQGRAQETLLSSRAGSNLRGCYCRGQGKAPGVEVTTSQEEQVSELPVFLSLLGDRVGKIEKALAHSW